MVAVQGGSEDSSVVRFGDGGTDEKTEDGSVIRTESPSFWHG